MDEQHGTGWTPRDRDWMKAYVIPALIVIGAFTVFGWLGDAVDKYQEWTAISCAKDPKHTHVVCRRPNGTFEHWTSGE